MQGFEINISFGLYAPRGTPRPVLEQLTAALQKSVTDPEVGPGSTPWAWLR